MVDQLPSFEFPPIDEMVIGVQFHPIKHFRMVHLWKYWSSVSERYPVCEDQSPLPHVVENPAVDPQKAQGFVQLSPFTGRVPVPRCWLIDSSKNELIQVQQDRFLRNWRRVQGNEVYPRFGTLFDRFFVEWTGFRGFLESEKLGRPHLDQFELSYINVIEPSPTWKGLSGLENYGLVEITIQQIRIAYAESKRSVKICRDDEDPSDGHVLICGKPNQKTKRQIRDKARWVNGKWPVKIQS